MSILRGILITAASLAYFQHICRVSAWTLPEHGLGGWLDSYFVNFLLEHWYRSLWHPWTAASPPVYFPAHGTLGYSHGLILFAPFYSLARLWYEPFQANTLMLLLVLESGALCLYGVLRRHLRLGVVGAAALSMLFITSPNVVNHTLALWNQRASVYLVPPLVWMALEATRRSGRGGDVLAFVCACATFLLFVQDFYTAAFAALLSGLMLAGVAVHERSTLAVAVRRLWLEARLVLHARPVARADRRWLMAALACAVAALIVAVAPLDRTLIGPLRVSARNPIRPAQLAVLFVAVALRHPIRSAVMAALQFLSVSFRISRRRVAAILAGAAVGLAIFAWIYVPAYLEHPEFPDEHLWNMLTDVQRLPWLDPPALLRALVVYESARMFGLAVVLAAMVSLPGAGRVNRFIAWWFVGVSVMAAAVPLAIGGISVWQVLFGWMPGLSIVRDPTRIIYLYELMAVLVAGVLLSREPRRLVRAGVVATVLAMVVTGWNARQLPFDRRADVFHHWVDAPITVPSSCRSFYMKGASQEYMSRSDHMWSLYAIDAGFIALRYGLPTLNGYSAWQPTG